MAVTITDVAKAVGVSPATVCRALSTPDVVRSATRERVQRAVEALGYRPNRAARGLITGKTGNLGIIVPDLANPFFPSVVKGAQARARESDYAVFLADTDENPTDELELVRALAKQVDGVVLCSPRMSEADLRSVMPEARLVLLNRRVGRVPSVTVNNADGMRQAVAHLTALGHSKIGYVGGPRGSWSNRERLSGLRRFTSAAGADLIEIGNVTPVFEGGVAAADRVVAAKVTAVVAYNDLVALGLLNRLATRGVAVPAELSVVGCDDVALAAMCHPALTTIALPKELIGRAGVDLLLNTLRHQPPPGGPTSSAGNAPSRGRANRRYLEANLVVRASTGPAPAS